MIEFIDNHFLLSQFSLGLFAMSQSDPIYNIMNECTVKAIVVTVIGCYWQSNECASGVQKRTHNDCVYL